MKIIFRNFLSVIRRFKMATLLNVLGLSVAFATCILIGIQLDYDWNYGKCHTGHKSIYRVEKVMDGEINPIFPGPFLDVFLNSSPYITAGTFSFNLPWDKELYLSFTDEEGMVRGFVEPALKVQPDFATLFDLSMVEGDIHAMRTPGNILVPLSIARKWFGNESAIGKVLQGPHRNYVVGGVYHDLPENTFVKNAVYHPLPREEFSDNWNNNSYEIYVRLDKQATPEIIIDNFLANLDPSIKGHLLWGTSKIQLTPLKEFHFQQNTAYDSIPKVSKTTLLVLLGIAIVIIVIAVINFTNFSIALTPMRVKNINTQKVLGAAQKTLRISMIAESVVISIIAFLIALYLVYVSRYTFIGNLVDAEVRLSNYVWLAGSVGLVALVIGFIAGLYPSFYTTSFSPALVLKGSFGLSPKGRKLRNVLIGVQYMASFILIICAVCMYCQNRFMQGTSLGYNKNGVLIAEMTETLKNNKERLISELKSYPEIEEVSFADLLISSSDQYLGMGNEVNGIRVYYQSLPVHYSLPQLLGIEVTEGRNFLREDAQKPNGALVMNETARTLFNLETGMQINGAEIVGFIPDIKFASFRSDIEPMAFQIWGGNYRFGIPEKYSYIKAGADADLYKVSEQIRQVYKSIDPAYAYEPRFYDSVLQQLYEKEDRLGALITLFGLIAVFISLVGVFGLVVFESEYKRKEIGVRKVFGSTVTEIIWMFNQMYMRIVIICFLIASPVAYYIILQWLENFAFRVPVYWWIFLFSFIVVSLITICTVTFQNWQAANANPVTSLKSE